MKDFYIKYTATDLITASETSEKRMKETDIYKTYNILNLQENTLFYNFDSGVDKDYFLNSDINFKLSAFVSYLTQRLIEQGVNVVDNVVKVINNYVKAVQLNIGANNV
ncbi:MAG: hypothetical protein Ta2D_10200 [Rickettsiales bacterium]|nr:MAG: hypothetical protein Ta2D_10200 [Rickettsiales bacterium]